MRTSLFLVCLLAALAVVLAFPEQGNSMHCTDNSRSCASAGECCSGCCSLGACASHDRCNAMSQGACAVHYCPPDKECYLQSVQCVTAPCPPVPACRPKNNDYDNYD